jgi:glycosyltransferase involved in cell wall biosynthesis
VQDGVTGLLVPPRAPEALAAAVLQLLRDPERGKRFGEAGRQRVARYFTAERMAVLTLRVYQQLLTARPAARYAGTRHTAHGEG